MPKDWNAHYENDDTPWDKGEAAPPLVEYLKGHSVAGSVLVPGFGAGHDVRLLAKQGADVLGLEIAEGAVRKAQSFECVADERYVVGDFLNLTDALHGQFDYVFEHTCLCALDLEQRETYAASVNQALKPGGHYLAIFYREVSDYHSEADGPPHPISEEGIDALFGKQFMTLERFVPTMGYPSRPYGAEEVRLMRKK